jgi:hypothetical protein
LTGASSFSLTRQAQTNRYDRRMNKSQFTQQENFHFVNAVRSLFTPLDVARLHTYLRTIMRTRAPERSPFSQ